jgi:uncharacterized protein (DUF2141 family)
MCQYNAKTTGLICNPQTPVNMKILGILMLLLMCGFSSSESVLKISIQGIANEHQGKTIYVGIWEANNTFFPDDQKPSIGLRGQISSNTFTISKSLAPGKYAISVYVDVNGNGKLDKNIFGAPKEPFGVSNNIIPKLSAPSLEECLVELKEHKAITIKLQ